MTTWFEAHDYASTEPVDVLWFGPSGLVRPLVYHPLVRVYHRPHGTTPFYWIAVPGPAETLLLACLN